MNPVGAAGCQALQEQKYDVYNYLVVAGVVLEKLPASGAADSRALPAGTRHLRSPLSSEADEKSHPSQERNSSARKSSSTFLY